MLERLPRSLEPDRLKILKRRHARRLDEKPQQVTLGGVSGLRESRTIALAKLDRLYIGIGYPEKQQNWSDLRIDADDAFGNSQHIADRTYRRALARLDTPYDPHEWVLTPQTVGAVLVFQQNAYEFAAALLQPPKYDSTASDAAA
jgi:predicted metalloendopeptidase